QSRKDDEKLSLPLLSGVKSFVLHAQEVVLKRSVWQELSPGLLDVRECLLHVGCFHLDGDIGIEGRPVKDHRYNRFMQRLEMKVADDTNDPSFDIPVFEIFRED